MTPKYTEFAKVGTPNVHRCTVLVHIIVHILYSVASVDKASIGEVAKAYAGLLFSEVNNNVSVIKLQSTHIYHK